MEVLNIALIGFGRIGQVHFDNIINKLNKKININVIADPYIHNQTEQYNDTFTREKISLLTDWHDIYKYNIDGIIIATPATMHVELIESALNNNKHVFCEKPVSKDINKLIELEKIINKSNKTVHIGLNRRYDPGVLALKQFAKSHNIRNIHITSRDPGLPSFDYIADSGGIFYDMSVHDYDMSNYLMDKPIRSVYCMSSVLVDSKLKDYNDFDTLITTIKYSDNSVTIINNSRQAIYGYDQRVELNTQFQKTHTQNLYESKITSMTDRGITHSKLKHFFIERYQDSYINEMIAFYHNCVTSLEQNHSHHQITSINDLIKAIKIADCAKQSSLSGEVIEYD